MTSTVQIFKSSISAAAAQLQQFLQQEGLYHGNIDGVIGDQTRDALMRAPEPTRSSAQVIFQRASGQALANVLAGKPPTPPGYYSLDTFTRELSAAGFTRTFIALAWQVARVESPVGDGISTLAATPSGTYLGPYQAGAAWWTDYGHGDYREMAVQLIPATHALSEEYAKFTSWIDSSANTANVAARALLKQGKAFPLFYLYHNQGPGGAQAYLTTGRLPNPDQSRQAYDLFAEVKPADTSTRMV